MRFSILHISDLHRDLNDEVPNEWLLQSLINDFDQFDNQDPKILKPSICIVSGDLIFGVTPNHEYADEELKRQYNQAQEFLIGLANRFFNGNRNCVVILPGNHDISFPDVMESLQKVDVPNELGEKRELVIELFKPNSKLRWSWADLCFFRIIDEKKYHERFRYFAEMYKNFYENHRTFPLESEEQYQVFDFPWLNFSIVALNSCHNNDPFHTVGSFQQTTFSRACQALQRPERMGWLVAAAWHHNIVSEPTKNDYLDAGFLQPLIDTGVSLGFHGHQNLSDCFDERYRSGPNPRKMTIISAGTLCAEPRNLLPGVPRSYNIVELDSKELSGRVHQRQMVNHRFDLPIWGPGHFITSNRSSLNFEICPPLKIRPAYLDLQLILERVDALMGSHKWAEALDILETIKEETQARIFLVKALEELGDGRRTINNLWPPLTNREVVTVGGAILESGTENEAENFMQLDLVSNNNDASVREVRERISSRCGK
jgi:hypothetical protein